MKCKHCSINKLFLQTSEKELAEEEEKLCQVKKKIIVL